MFTFKPHQTASTLTGIQSGWTLALALATCTSSLCDFSQPGARALEQEVETQRGRGRGRGAVGRDAQSSGMHFFLTAERKRMLRSRI